MQDEITDKVLINTQQQSESVDDCWSLLLAESGEHRLNNLSQLLSLTSIIEREYIYICASRVLNGQSTNDIDKSK